MSLLPIRLFVERSDLNNQYSGSLWKDWSVAEMDEDEKLAVVREIWTKKVLKILFYNNTGQGFRKSWHFIGELDSDTGKLKEMNELRMLMRKARIDLGESDLEKAEGLFREALMEFSEVVDEFIVQYETGGRACES